MMHEWRDNLWLMLGLAIVSLVIWLFCSGLFSVMRYYFLPKGFDETDVYSVWVGTLGQDPMSYYDNMAADLRYKNRVDLDVLLERIKKNSNVESAGYISWGGPYSGSSTPRIFYRADESDSIGYSGALVNISPEVVKVFKLKSLTGKDEDWLQEKLEAGELLVTPDPTLDEKKELAERLQKRFDNYGNPLISLAPEDIYGRYVYSNYDTINKLHVADIVQLMRADHFRQPISGNAFQKIDDYGQREVRQILIRMKPGHGEKFRKEFESTPEMQKLNNMYLSELTKMTDQAVVMERGYWLNVRLYVALISFFLIILFLGLLGTFWFRVQQRVSEIAIRRVCGASKGAIFRRILGEGMILLVGATIIAGIVGWIIVKKTNIIAGYSNSEIIWFEVATMVLVAIGIVISISYPAWKAMNIEPAVAVRDE